MARGKGTPKRNHIDPDFSPTSPTPAPSSPSTPRRTPSTSAPTSSTSSPRSTLSLSQPQAEKPTRGPLPPAAETTYHQRLRAILVDSKKLRRTWNELVIRGLVGRVRAAIELWVDIESTLKQLETPKKQSSRPNPVKVGYLFAQSAKLSDQIEAVEAVFGNLVETHTTMSQLVERAEWLVVEAAKTRGTVFAFREPLWVTWPLSRFADGIANLTIPYTSSLTLIRQLLDTLTTFPPLPTALDPSLPPPSTGATSKTDSLKPTKEPKVRTRPSPEQLQSSLSLLAVQPLLPGKQGDWGSEGWEEILSVEVGGWGEK